MPECTSKVGQCSIIINGETCKYASGKTSYLDRIPMVLLEPINGSRSCINTRFQPRIPAGIKPLGSINNQSKTGTLRQVPMN